MEEEEKEGGIYLCSSKAFKNVLASGPSREER